MRRTMAFAAAVAVCICALICGCTPKVDKSPDQYEGIRWISYDYSFCIQPENNCEGYYRFGDKKYNIRVTFDSFRLTAADTDNSDRELFSGDWMYEKNEDGIETLYIYNIDFNKEDYEEFKTNYAEFVTLKQELL